MFTPSECHVPVDQPVKAVVREDFPWWPGDIACIQALGPQERDRTGNGAWRARIPALGPADLCLYEVNSEHLKGGEVDSERGELANDLNAAGRGPPAGCAAATLSAELATARALAELRVN